MGIASKHSNQLTRLLCSYRRYISSSVVLLGAKRSERFAAITINKQIVDLGRQNYWEKILNVYEKKRDKFNNVNYSTTMSQIGRIHSFDRKNPVFLRFLDDLANNIEHSGLRWIGVREVSTIIHAMGKMRLSNNTGKRIFQLLSRLENAQEFLAKAEPQSVSNVAWAFARVEFIPKDFFEEINKCAQWLVLEGKPQAVANTAWACAKLGFSAPNLLAEIDHRAEWLLREGKPQEVANTAWSCATLGFDAPILFAELDHRAERLVKEGTPQAVANMAWACAALGFNASNLFSEIGRNAKWLVKSGNPQAVTNTAWASAKLGISAPNLFAEIDHHAEWLVNEGKPQNVANAAWSCATLGFDAPSLFAEIDHHAEWLVREGKPKEVVSTAWACAMLGFDAPNLFAEIEASRDQLLPNLTEQDVANICYAIAIADLSWRFKRILVDLWDMIMHMPSWDALNNKHLIQLAQAQLYAKLVGIDLAELPGSLSGRIERAMNGSKENTVNDSHRVIANVLHELGLCFDFEVSPVSNASFGQMLAIDLACKEQKIAFELVRPFHFLKELGTGKVTSSENGPTKAKRRFLEQLGWRVINVDYRDWIIAERGGNERPWLREKLRSLGIALFDS